MNEIDIITEHYNAKQAKIKAISDVLAKKSTKISNVELPDGSTQTVSQTQNPFSGKPVYTVAKDDKNVMTFATKKQLLDYLGE